MSEPAPLVTFLSDYGLAPAVNRGPATEVLGAGRDDELIVCRA